MHVKPQRLPHLQEAGQRKDSAPSTQAYHDKMNALAQEYYEKSDQLIVPKKGLVDEIVSFADMRK